MLHERDYMQPDRPEPASFQPSKFKVNQFILIVLVVTFFLQHTAKSFQLFAPGEIFALTPSYVVESLYIWQLVTYLFLHESLFQFLFVMLGFYFFGQIVERYFNQRRYLYFIVATGVLSALIYTPIAYIGRSAHATIFGASSAVMGILIVAAMKKPDMKVLVFFILPMKMKYMVMIFVGIDFWYLLQQQEMAFAAVLPRLAGAGLGYLYVTYQQDIESYLRKLEQDHPRPSNTSSPPSSSPSPQPTRSHSVNPQEIDRILDKIQEEGFHNLTSKERGKLEQASEDLKEDDS